MSNAAPEQQKELDELKAKVEKTNSWWQAYRRANPLAVQNCILFGIVPLVGTICFLIGRAVGAK